MHKTTVSVLQAPRMVRHKHCKIFLDKISINSLRPNMTESNISHDGKGFKKLCEICVKTLNKHVPHTQNLVRGNHSPFINKELSKGIMK